MISKEEVIHIAKLARLELTDEDIVNMQKDMSAILDYFEILKKAKTSNSKDQILQLENVLREDEVLLKRSSLAGDLVKLAPERKEEHIKVKQIL
ncbi:MAG: Asp-tRNA(Asn)/Glu-tRNA(Gln) amidotransferase subunit GatC [Candidatus Staskawiczbacteria bacterium]|nr:Asp-tRNA(Asn)/Glu-tRNA(Gln) amidotransferase subunit GatC [Candidatus Staskawiczbacteria bacterium]